MPDSPRRRGALPRPAAQRVLARIVISEMGYGTPCWLFQGAITSAGYGNVGSRRDDHDYYETTHRVVYAAAYGPIPDGLQLDHLCSSRTCVNPAHLEVVTSYENGRRQELRRTGRVDSWLDASQNHVFAVDRPGASLTVEAMRRSRPATKNS